MADEPKGTSWDTFTVEVYTASDEQVLRWEGQAENVSDALHRALDQRDEEMVRYLERGDD